MKKYVCLKPDNTNQSLTLYKPIQSFNKPKKEGFWHFRKRPANQHIFLAYSFVYLFKDNCYHFVNIWFVMYILSKLIGIELFCMEMEHRYII